MARLHKLCTSLLVSCLVGYLQLCSGLPTADEPRQAQPQPLLTIAQGTPDLSRFYALSRGTGGESGGPGPDLEDRFNNPRSSLQYTLLAPTNDVRNTVSPKRAQG